MPCEKLKALVLTYELDPSHIHCMTPERRAMVPLHWFTSANILIQLQYITVIRNLHGMYPHNKPSILLNDATISLSLLFVHINTHTHTHTHTRLTALFPGLPR